jgi:hypothetical protein
MSVERVENIMNKYYIQNHIKVHLKDGPHSQKIIKICFNLEKFK